MKARDTVLNEKQQAEIFEKYKYETEDGFASPTEEQLKVQAEISFGAGYEQALKARHKSC